MVSSVNTGIAGISVTTLVPLVDWALNGFPHPVPEAIPYLIATGLLAGGHAAYNYLAQEAK